MHCNRDEDEDETKTNKVEVVRENQLQLPSNQFSPNFQLDPISTFLLLPVLPLVYLFNLHSQLMSQMTNPLQSINKSSGGKVTTITRDGNNLTIVEKYL